MIYLLYGTEKYLIDLEINKIIKQHKIDEINIIKYDLDIDFFKEVIDDCQTISLFSNKKLIIVDNPFTELSKEDENLLENYINSPNLDTILILRCSKLDERKKIIKLQENEKISLEGEKVIITLPDGEEIKFNSRLEQINLENEIIYVGKYL